MAPERGPWSSAGSRACHSSSEKAGGGPVGSGLRRELEETGAVRRQETLSSHSPIGVDWVKAFRDGVQQL